VALIRDDCRAGAVAAAVAAAVNNHSGNCGYFRVAGLGLVRVDPEPAKQVTLRMLRAEPAKQVAE